MNSGYSAIHALLFKGAHPASIYVKTFTYSRNAAPRNAWRQTVLLGEPPSPGREKEDSGFLNNALASATGSSAALLLPFTIPEGMGSCPGVAN